MDASPLAGWDNFYVIVGSSAAALTGLTFVLVALSKEAAGGVRPAGLAAFVSPTIVHFSGVFALAGYLSMPHQTLTGLRIAFGLGGLAGVVYGLTIARRMHLQSGYLPVREDWIWNVIVPTLLYLCLMGAAVWLRYEPSAALYCVGAVALALLLVGIRNAWDIAVWMAVYRKRENPDAGGGERS